MVMNATQLADKDVLLVETLKEKAERVDVTSTRIMGQL
jgi:hypothetical protein